MRLESRRTAALAAMWCLVVAGCATVIWVAIDSAGRSVLESSSRPAGSVVGSSSRMPAPGQSSWSSPTSPRTTASPLPPSPTEVVRPATTRGGGPSSRPVSRPTGRPPVTPSSPPRTTPPNTPPPSASKTVQTAGGAAGFRCTGGRIQLAFARPAIGWAFTLENDDTEFAVKFSSATGEIEIKAHCGPDGPVTSTE